MKKVMKKIVKICLQFYSVKNQEIGQSKIIKKIDRRQNLKSKQIF